MNEDQQLREAAMRLAIQSDGNNNRPKSLRELVEAAALFEHYLRTGQLPQLPPGRSSW